MGMNRHTDIKKNRISKTILESYDNKRQKFFKIHFFINLRKKVIVLLAHFCVIKHNFENIANIL